MSSHISVLLVSFLFVFLLIKKSTANSSPSYNVMDFGAAPDGRTDSTEAFLSAWSAACSSWTSATMYVPAGKFLLAKKAVFSGPCKNNAIVVKIDGTIVAPSDYNVFKDNYYWILFIHVEGIMILGGVLDGQGLNLWNCKAFRRTNCPRGVTVCIK